MTAPNLDVARRRLEQLAAKGQLSKTAVRMDLRTIAFLEAHPERTFPKDAAAWAQEVGRFFWIGDPGAYRILRVMVLDGRMAEREWSRALRACAVYIGAGFAVFMAVGLLGMSMLVRFLRDGIDAVVRAATHQAALPLVFTAGGIAMGLAMYFSFRNEFRKLDRSIDALD